MPYTLYGSRGSGSAAIEAALVLAALPYDTVHAASWEPDSRLDALREVNPLVQVPAVVTPGGDVLTESAAILVHLGLVAPAGTLLPKDEARRAQAIRGLVFIAANCYSAISIIDYPERWTTHTAKDDLDAIRAGTRARMHRHWEIFADTFAGDTPFLSGAEPGALDCLAAVVSRWSGTRPHVKAQRPAFAEVLQRVDTHPKLAAVFAKHWPA